MRLTIYMIIVIIFTVLSSSCASFSNLDSSAFARGDVPDRQLVMESAQCEMEGEKSRSMQGMGGLAGIASHYETFNRVYDACMRAKGYMRKK
jgi:hypothetical protein